MATKKTTSKSKISPKKRVSEADIQSKAHDIYQSRLKDGTPGDAHSDWLQAKKELGV